MDGDLLKMRLLVFFLAVALSAQAIPVNGTIATSTPNAWGPGSTVTYYVNTSTGADTNPCTSGSPCKTLGHVVGPSGIIPPILTTHYVVNVADGTYGEAVDAEGYFGFLSGNPALQITGDVSTPGNVVFTGSVAACARFKSGVCVTGGTNVGISGIDVAVTTSTRNSVTCDHCNLTLTAVTIGGAMVAGIDNVSGQIYLNGPIVVSGFTVTDISGTGGFAVDTNNGGLTQFASGTTTLTGPSSSTAALGIVCEFNSACLVSPVSDAGSTSIGITMTNLIQGINVTANSSFTGYVATGTISIVNSATPAGSTAINAGGDSSFNVAGMPLVLTDFTTCFNGNGVSLVQHGAAARTLTGCGTTSVTSQGGVVSLY